MSDPRIDADMLSVVRRPTRLRALAELATNAESSAEALDRTAQVACRVLHVPVALVNLIGADEQRFVGCSGGEPWASLGEMPIDAGFCPFALGSEDAYALDDARANSELAANPAVQQFGVVAYAGVPLRAADGEPIGTLCAIDYEPRKWRDEDLGLLADLAAGVIAELQLLTATRLLAQHEARMRALAGLSAALVPAQTPADVLREVSRSVDRFDVDALWLSVVDEPAQTLRTAAASGAESEAVPLPDATPCHTSPATAAIRGCARCVSKRRSRGVERDPLRVWQRVEDRGEVVAGARTDIKDHRRTVTRDVERGTPTPRSAARSSARRRPQRAR